MMKYINLYQPQIVEYNLTLVEWVVLDYIVKANSWARSLEKDWINYFQVNAWKILKDLPALGIKTDKWILDKIKTLTEEWLLKRYSKNMPYYAVTDKTKNYYFGWNNEMVNCNLPNGNMHLTKWLDNSNINNSNVKQIYIPVDQVKEKSKRLAGDIEKLLSFLIGETDLIDVDYTEIIELRNDCYETHKLPRVNTSNLETVMVKSIKKQWLSFKREFTKEEFNVGLQNYLKEIKKRKQDWKVWSYYDHRFTLFQFLSQGNWIKKYMALWEWYE